MKPSCDISYESYFPRWYYLECIALYRANLSRFCCFDEDYSVVSSTYIDMFDDNYYKLSTLDACHQSDDESSTNQRRTINQTIMRLRVSDWWMCCCSCRLPMDFHLDETRELSRIIAVLLPWLRIGLLFLILLVSSASSYPSFRMV